MSFLAIFGSGKLEQKKLGSARIFASHYQLLICDDPSYRFPDDENWQTREKQLYAGNPRHRMIGTEADLNDHWVELWIAPDPPIAAEWDRVICVDFECQTKNVFVMSVIDNKPPIKSRLTNGNYSLFMATQNLGVDPVDIDTISLQTLETSLKKAEWHKLILVPRSHSRTGIIAP